MTAIFYQEKLTPEYCHTQHVRGLVSVALGVKEYLKLKNRDSCARFIDMVSLYNNFRVDSVAVKGSVSSCRLLRGRGVLNRPGS